MTQIHLKDDRPSIYVKESLNDTVIALRNVRPGGWLVFEYGYPEQHVAPFIVIRESDIDHVEGCLG